MRIVPETTVDGIGWRTTVYCAGCRHHCNGCHNQETWDFSAGIEMSIDEVFAEIMRYDSNVTFSGGDPMYQADEFTELAKRVAASGKTIWCYTGFTYEEVLSSRPMRAMLPYLEVLVDGLYEDEKKDDSLLFRGSSNQRLIDVKRSIRYNRAIEWEYDPYPKFA